MKLKRPERLVEVQARMARGQSMRSIARDLEVDDGTIRNDVKVLRLGSEVVSSVKNGAPAQGYLVAERKALTQQLLLRRKAEEELDGRHSNDLALRIVDYLNNEPLFDADREMIMAMMVRELWREQQGDRPVSPRTNIARTLRACVGGLDDEMPTRIQQYVDGLVAAMVLLAPERLVRDRAVQKLGWASKVLEKKVDYAENSRSWWENR